VFDTTNDNLLVKIHIYLKMKDIDFDFNDQNVCVMYLIELMYKLQFFFLLIQTTLWSFEGQNMLTATKPVNISDVFKY